MQDELFKKRAQCVKLQNRLDNTAESLRKIVDYKTTTSSLTEDKELNQAMEAQKAINRYLCVFFLKICVEEKSILICMYAVIIDTF